MFRIKLLLPEIWVLLNLSLFNLFWPNVLCSFLKLSGGIETEDWAKMLNPSLPSSILRIFIQKLFHDTLKFSRKASS